MYVQPDFDEIVFDGKGDSYNLFVVALSDGADDSMKVMTTTMMMMTQPWASRMADHE